MKRIGMIAGGLYVVAWVALTLLVVFGKAKFSIMGDELWVGVYKRTDFRKWPRADFLHQKRITWNIALLPCLLFLYPRYEKWELVND